MHFLGGQSRLAECELQCQQLQEALSLQRVAWLKKVDELAAMRQGLCQLRAFGAWKWVCFFIGISFNSCEFLRNSQRTEVSRAKADDEASAALVERVVKYFQPRGLLAKMFHSWKLRSFQRRSSLSI